MRPWGTTATLLSRQSTAWRREKPFLCLLKRRRANIAIAWPPRGEVSILQKKFGIALSTSPPLNEENVRNMLRQEMACIPRANNEKFKFASYDECNVIAFFAVGIWMGVLVFSSSQKWMALYILTTNRVHIMHKSRIHVVHFFVLGSVRVWDSWNHLSRLRFTLSQAHAHALVLLSCVTSQSIITGIFSVTYLARVWLQPFMLIFMPFQLPLQYKTPITKAAFKLGFFVLACNMYFDTALLV